MSTEMDEAKLTAYALGELPPDECAEVDAHLKTCERDRQFIEDTFAISGSVRAALKSEVKPEPALSEQQRSAIICGAPRGSDLGTSPWLFVLAVAGVFVAVLIGFVQDAWTSRNVVRKDPVTARVEKSDIAQNKNEIPKTPENKGEPKTVATTGTVSGIVKFAGNVPPPHKFTIPEKDHAGCKCSEIDSEEIVVDPETRGLKWAIVRIMNVKTEEMPQLTDVEIDQKGCRFSPHVVVVAPGARVRVTNPDKIAHNVHTTPYDGTNTALNRMMLPTDTELSLQGGKFFSDPEVIKLQCDIHPWMTGFIVVHDPRFAAVTGADGKFSIPNVPPGEYEVTIFHELGERVLNVKVPAGETSKLEAVFTLK